MICRSDLNYCQMGYTDGSHFLHKGIRTWREATQFPQFSPAQKAHTTVRTVGLCFPEAINADGCSHKGALSVCFLICECIYLNLLTETQKFSHTWQIANHQHGKLFPLHKRHPPHCYTQQLPRISAQAPLRGEGFPDHAHPSPRTPAPRAPVPSHSSLGWWVKAAESVQRFPTLLHVGITWGAGKTIDAGLPAWILTSTALRCNPGTASLKSATGIWICSKVLETQA